MSYITSPQSMSSTQNESPKIPVPSLLQEVINMQNFENFLSADLNVSEVEVDGGMMNACNEKIKHLDTEMKKLVLENKTLRKELSELKDQVIDSWDSILNEIFTSYNSIHADQSYTR